MPSTAICVPYCLRSSCALITLEKVTYMRFSNGVVSRQYGGGYCTGGESDQASVKISSMTAIVGEEPGITPRLAGFSRCIVGSCFFLIRIIEKHQKSNIYLYT
jgi:hypothetical protein